MHLHAGVHAHSGRGPCQFERLNGWQAQCWAAARPGAPHRAPCRTLSYNLNTGEFSLTSSGDYDDSDEFYDGDSPTAMEGLLSASTELQQLAHLSLTLLVSALELGLAQMGKDAPATLRCAVYSRSPGSLSTGKLQLQLVAATDGHESEAALARQDLFLGAPSNGTYEEAWIVEQPVIMLPDSGGLVLPLAHNSFLVGLLVVERGRPEGEVPMGAAAPPQPPATALFGAADLKIIRQSGQALALACAMDLRAALERAGHAVKQRQVQGLVRQAKKPLSTLRTLTSMLRPRLEEGEPERDMTDGILAQGERLSELVTQLQAALAPMPPSPAPLHSAAGAAWAAQVGSPGRGSRRYGQSPQRQQQQAVQYPALPSSSIGSDYYSPAALSSSETEPVASALGSSRRSDATSDAQSTSGVARSVLDASTDLLSVLVPLLGTAANFASVSGVAFMLAPEGGSNEAVAHLPAATVAVDVLTLKRMLAVMLDGVMACSGRGDRIEAAVQLQPRDGWDGVSIAVQLLQGPGSTPDEGAHMLPEFVHLATAARQCGGWFYWRAGEAEEEVEWAQRVQHVHRGALAAVLWLPTTAAAGCIADDMMN